MKDNTIKDTIQEEFNLLAEEEKKQIKKKQPKPVVVSKKDGEGSKKEQADAEAGQELTQLKKEGDKSKISSWLLQRGTQLWERDQIGFYEPVNILDKSDPNYEKYVKVMKILKAKEDRGEEVNWNELPKINMRRDWIYKGTHPWLDEFDDLDEENLAYRADPEQIAILKSRYGWLQIGDSPPRIGTREALAQTPSTEVTVYGGDEEAATSRAVRGDPDNPCIKQGTCHWYEAPFRNINRWWHGQKQIGMGSHMDPTVSAVSWQDPDGKWHKVNVIDIEAAQASSLEWPGKQIFSEEEASRIANQIRKRGTRFGPSAKECGDPSESIAGCIQPWEKHLVQPSTPRHLNFRDILSAQKRWLETEEAKGMRADAPDPSPETVDKIKAAHDKAKRFPEAGTIEYGNWLPNLPLKYDTTWTKDNPWVLGAEGPQNPLRTYFEKHHHDVGATEIMTSLGMLPDFEEKMDDQVLELAAREGWDRSWDKLRGKKQKRLKGKLEKIKNRVLHGTDKQKKEFTEDIGKIQANIELQAVVAAAINDTAGPDGNYRLKSVFESGSDAVFEFFIAYAADPRVKESLTEQEINVLNNFAQTQQQLLETSKDLQDKYGETELAMIGNYLDTGKRWGKGMGGSYEPEKGFKGGKLLTVGDMIHLALLPTSWGLGGLAVSTFKAARFAGQAAKYGAFKTIVAGAEGFFKWRARGGHWPWWPIKNARIKYPEGGYRVVPPKQLPVPDSALQENLKRIIQEEYQQLLLEALPIIPKGTGGTTTSLANLRTALSKLGTQIPNVGHNILQNLSAIKDFNPGLMDSIKQYLTQQRVKTAPTGVEELPSTSTGSPHVLDYPWASKFDIGPRGAPHVEPHGVSTEYLGTREAPGEPANLAATEENLEDYIRTYLHLGAPPGTPYAASEPSAQLDLFPQWSGLPMQDFPAAEYVAPGIRDVLTSIIEDVRAGVVSPGDAVAHVMEYYPREAETFLRARTEPGFEQKVDAEARRRMQPGSGRQVELDTTPAERTARREFDKAVRQRINKLEGQLSPAPEAPAQELAVTSDDLGQQRRTYAAQYNEMAEKLQRTPEGRIAWYRTSAPRRTADLAATLGHEKGPKGHERISHDVEILYNDPGFYHEGMIPTNYGEIKRFMEEYGIPAFNELYGPIPGVNKIDDLMEAFIDMPGINPAGQEWITDLLTRKNRRANLRARAQGYGDPDYVSLESQIEPFDTLPGRQYSAQSRDRVINYIVAKQAEREYSDPRTLTDREKEQMQQDLGARAEFIYHDLAMRAELRELVRARTELESLQENKIKLLNIIKEERQKLLKEEKKHILVDMVLTYDKDFKFYGYVLNQIRAISGVTIARADESGVVDIYPDKKKVLLHLKFMPDRPLAQYLYYIKGELEKLKDMKGIKILSAHSAGIPSEIA